MRRGRADIEVIKLGGWKIAAIMWLLRSSLVLKALAVLILGLLFLGSALLGFSIALLCYALIQLGRFYKSWKKAGLPVGVLFAVPVVKLTMDLAIDCGRILTIGSSIVR